MRRLELRLKKRHVQMVITMSCSVVMNPLSVFLRMRRPMALLARFWTVMNHWLCGLSSFFFKYSASSMYTVPLSLRRQPSQSSE